MSLSQIITDSIKYPFSDLKKFAIVGIIALLAGISNVFPTLGVDNGAVLLIGIVISLIFALILSGFGLSVIKKAVGHADEIPDIDPVNNFIDGIKVLVISIVYFLIPFIITLILAMITGAIGAGLDNVVAAFGVIGVLALIVFIIFAIFEIIALARFAKADEFGAAFNFGEIFEDIKNIGILKILALIIIAIIIIIIASIIASVFALIPFVGIIIAEILIGAFVVLFYNRAIGLLYAEL